MGNCANLWVSGRAEAALNEAGKGARLVPTISDSDALLKGEVGPLDTQWQPQGGLLPVLAAEVPLGHA